MGKNHDQNTRTIWSERPPPTANPALLISSGRRTRRARLSYSARYLTPCRSIWREHYRSEYLSGRNITAPRIHSTRSRETQPGTRCGKSPLHQVRASHGREPDPSSPSAPVNSNYPAPILPGQVRGRQARCPRTTRLYRLHRTRGRPLQSSSRIRPRRPATTYQTPECLRDSPRHLPESRDAWGPAAWPGAATEAGRRDGGQRRVRGGQRTARAP
jgi:hypothetical protein